MRALVLGTLLVTLGSEARADDAAASWSAAAGLGAGLEGAAPVSALDVRGDLAWDGGAIGLGARLRVVGDALATRDWNDLADWLATLRYLVLRDRDDRARSRLDEEAAPRAWRAALAAGQLGVVHLGDRALVDGFSSAALVDRRATGAHLRVGRGDADAELVIADLVRGTLVAAAGSAPAGPLRLGAAAAVDPRAPVRDAAGMIETAPLGAVTGTIAIEAERDRRRGALAVDVGWQPGLGAGAALIGTGSVRLGERVVVRGRGEVGAGSDGWIAAPFGPLYLRLRDGDGRAMAPTLLDRARAGELGGLGGAAEVAIDVDDLGGASLGARLRPGLGTELDARATLPALAGVQLAALAAWLPAARDALLVGVEAHAELGRGRWSGLELSRQYRAGDEPGLYAARPVWQVTAWFGLARY